MTQCVYLPLDGRPCNARFPIELAQLAGFSVHAPETRLLGTAATPASLRGLDRWLHAACESRRPDYLMLSLDTWLYGNLVASRKSTQSIETLTTRFQQLLDLKGRYPQLKICVMATLLRMSNSNDATEERPYWAQHGQQIYRYAYLDDRIAQQVTPAGDLSKDIAEYEALQQAIPESVLIDYRQLRQRNHQLLKLLLEAVAEGQIEQALIGCDDSGAYGWNVQERKALEQYKAELKLGDRLRIYPGADELAAVLFARVLVPENYTLQVQWTHPEAREVVTRYEGQPLCVTLEAQAEAAGLALSEPDEPEATAPDGYLWLHQPSEASLSEHAERSQSPQIDQFLDRESRAPVAPENYHRLKEYIARYTSPSESVKPFMLADVVYANGGDAALLRDPELSESLFKLQGYAAWNTAGNTLGYMLAWFKFYLYALSQCEAVADAEQLEVANRKLLLERIADDGLYQGQWRQEWCQHYTDPVTLNTCVQGIYAFNERFKVWSSHHEWIAQQGTPQIKRLSFPWKRFFEVDLQICWPEQVCNTL